MRKQQVKDGTDIGQCGWIIALASCIAAALYYSSQCNGSNPNSDCLGNRPKITNVPNFTWWSIAYMLLCIVGVAITIALDAVHTYHVAITAFMACGLVFTTSSINSLIVYPQASMEAASAGFILLSIVCVSMEIASDIITLTGTGRMDVLLRLSTTGIASPDTELLRSSQRASSKPIKQTYDSVLPPRDAQL